MPKGIYQRTDEYRKKLSESAKLRKRTPLSYETKQKISKAQKGKPRPYQSGEKHGMWLGDEVGYMGIHSWFRNKKRDKCDFCGSSERLELALRKGFEHARRIENYHTLCVPCHRKYDAREPWNKGQQLVSNKKCEVCSCDFRPARRTRRFCSNGCAGKHRYMNNKIPWLAINKKT